MDYNNSETDFYTELDKLRISGTETDIVTITKRFSNNYDTDLLESLLKDIELYLFIERDIKESEFTNIDVDFAVSELSKNGLQIPYKKRKSFDELTERQRQNRERMELKNITLPKQTIDLEKLLFPFEFYCIYQLKNKIEIAIRTKPKQETTFTNSLEFFNKINQNLVSELDTLNFVESTTNKEIHKLELLYIDIEKFEIDFIVNEITDVWLCGKVNEKRISESFKKFKDLVFNMINKNASTNTLDYSKESKKMYFKVGLLFAQKKIFSKIVTVNGFKTTKYHYENEIFDNPNQLSKHLKLTRQYINDSFTEANSNHNIFNNIKQLKNIIDYCNENKITIDESFLIKYSTLIENRQ